MEGENGGFLVLSALFPAVLGLFATVQDSREKVSLAPSPLGQGLGFLD